MSFASPSITLFASFSFFPFSTVFSSSALLFSLWTLFRLSSFLPSLLLSPGTSSSCRCCGAGGCEWSTQANGDVQTLTLWWWGRLKVRTVTSWLVHVVILYGCKLMQFATSCTLLWCSTLGPNLLIFFVSHRVLYLLTMQAAEYYHYVFMHIHISHKRTLQCQEDHHLICAIVEGFFWMLCSRQARLLVLLSSSRLSSSFVHVNRQKYKY